jgi:hypothetical protein
MKAYVLAIILALPVLTAGATSWSEDDSHYVALGGNKGYYIVRPDSQLFRQLGLYDAPWIDTADRLRHGYGADVLAFQFNRKGVLVTPPAYIAQESIYAFYTRRIGSFVLGHTTTGEVEAMFGHGHSVSKRPNGFMYYYSLPIYNPFEDWLGDGK